MSIVTILIVEDHEITRLGFRLILEQYSQFSVVGEAANGKAAVESALALKPAVVLMDIGLPELNGIEATRKIKAELSQTRIIMLTSHENRQDICAAIEAGADGYCLKTIAEKRLISAILRVHAGEFWIDPNAVRRILETGPCTQPDSIEATDSSLLSPVESNVLGLVARELSIREISDRLSMSTEELGLCIRRSIAKVQAQLQLSTIVEATDDAVLSHDLCGLITSWNRGATALYGYTREDLIGKPISIISTEPADNETEELVAKLARGEKIAPYEIVRRRKDGSLVTVFVSYSPLLDASGELVAVASIARDITHSKEIDRQFQAVVEACPVGMIMVDLDGKILLVNSAIEKLFGYTSGEVVGMAVEMFLPERLRQIHQTKRSLYLTDPQPTTVGTDRDFPGRRKDGSEFCCEISLTPFKRDKKTYVLVSVLDITRRKEAERRINDYVARIARLATIVDSSTDAILSLNTDEIITSWNAGAETMFGYSADEAIGKHISIVHTPGHPDKHALRKLRKSESIRSYDTVRYHRDGKPIEVSLSVSPVTNEAGDTIGYGAVVHDITKQKKRQRELDRLAAVVRSTCEAIVNTDLKGIITSWNHAAEILFGYSAEEAIGKIITFINHPDYNPRSLEMLERLLQGEYITSIDHVFLRKDRTTVHANVALFPIKNEGGVIIETAGIIRDTSEENRQKEALMAANLALTKQAGELTIARDQAQSATKLKSAFVATMSHEIRTPISAVIGMCNILESTNLDEQQHRYLSTIEDAASSLLTVINDVLDFSKIEAGKLELGIADFDLVGIVESSCDLLATQAQSKNLSLMSFIDPELPRRWSGDSERIRQVLVNLIGNALKFSSRGEIVVRATPDAVQSNKAQIRFSVSDQGVGLSYEEQQQLFQPFVQIDGSVSRNFGGTGLGLSICKRLVTLMGGTIGVKSVKGEGSTFWFSIPLERQSDMPLTSVHPDLGNMHILIIGEEPGTREILQNYIDSWGMRGVGVTDTGQALESLRQACRESDPFRVAIVDLIKPHIDGFELARQVLHDSTIGSTSLILLTTNDRDGFRKQAIEAGFTSHITKPLRQSQLLDCLTQLVVASKQAGAASETAAGSKPRAGVSGLTAPGLVLVAEDHLMSQQVAIHYVSKAGYACHAVTNGAEAVRAVATSKYALVLMDCQMPEMDGYAASLAIRKAEALTGRHIPIIAVTANAMAGDREKCLAAGMDDYIAKPIDPRQLRELFKKWISRNQADSAGKAVEQEIPLTGPPIQLETLHETLPSSLISEMLDLFISMTPESLDKIDNAIKHQEASELARAAHFLKGSCVSVYATGMKDLCISLETSAREHNWFRAAETYKQLEKSFFETKDYLNRLSPTGSKP